MSARTTATDGKGFVTAKPIAEFYSVKEATIYRWAEEDKIPCMRFEGTVRFNFEKVRVAMEGKPAANCARTEADTISVDLANFELARAEGDPSWRRTAVNRILMEFVRRIEPDIEGLIAELRESTFDRNGAGPR